MPCQETKMLFDNPPQGMREVIDNLYPAVTGTLVSMCFTSGAWKKRLAQGVIGVPFSMQIAPSVYRWVQSMGWDSIDKTGAGVLAAVFGLAVVAFCFELLRQLQIGPILNEWFRKKLGLAPKPDARD